MLIRYLTIVKSLAIIVIAASLAVMAGWIFNITILKSILPSWVTMKFLTACSFFLSGVSLYSIACVKSKNSQLAQLVLILATLCIFLIMATLLTSSFLKLYTGIEELFVKEQSSAINTTVPGRPAVFTMLAFVLIGLAGVFSVFGLKNAIVRKSVDLIIIFIGALAIVGYIINKPAFYYHLGSFSTAMACHTAVLFVLLGAGLLLSEK